MCVCKHDVCILLIIHKKASSSVESNLWGFFQICGVVLELLCFFDVLESSFQFSRARLVEITSLVRGRCHLQSVSPDAQM